MRAQVARILAHRSFQGETDIVTLKKYKYFFKVGIAPERLVSSTLAGFSVLFSDAYRNPVHGMIASYIADISKAGDMFHERRKYGKHALL